MKSPLTKLYFPCLAVLAGCGMPWDDSQPDPTASIQQEVVAPTRLEGVSAYQTVWLRWNPGGAASYTVKYKPSANTAWSTYTPCASIANTQCKVTNLTNNVNYDYQVFSDGLSAGSPILTLQALPRMGMSLVYVNSMLSPLQNNGADYSTNMDYWFDRYTATQLGKPVHYATKNKTAQLFKGYHTTRDGKRGLYEAYHEIDPTTGNNYINPDALYMIFDFESGVDYAQSTEIAAAVQTIKDFCNLAHQIPHASGGYKKCFLLVSGSICEGTPATMGTGRDCYEGATTTLDSYNELKGVLKYNIVGQTAYLVDRWGLQTQALARYPAYWTDIVTGLAQQVRDNSYGKEVWVEFSGGFGSGADWTDRYLSTREHVTGYWFSVLDTETNRAKANEFLGNRL